MRKLLIICCLFAVASLSNTAIAQKFGHTNSAELYNSLPEWKAAESELQTYAQQLQAKLKSDEEDYLKDAQALVQEIQAGKLSPVDQETKEKEFRAREQILLQQQNESNQKVSQKEQELFLPIRQRVNDAISEIMEAGQYAYVFDIASGVVLPGPTSEDITPQIKEKLGIK